jgi:hypothetical protein
MNLEQVLALALSTMTVEYRQQVPPFTWDGRRSGWR